MEEREINWQDKEVRSEVRTTDAFYALCWARKVGSNYELRHRAPKPLPDGKVLFLWNTDVVPASRILSIREVSDE